MWPERVRLPDAYFTVCSSFTFVKLCGEVLSNSTASGSVFRFVGDREAVRAIQEIGHLTLEALGDRAIAVLNDKRNLRAGAQQLAHPAGVNH